MMPERECGLANGWEDGVHDGVGLVDIYIREKMIFVIEQNFPIQVTFHGCELVRVSENTSSSKPSSILTSETYYKWSSFIKRQNINEQFLVDIYLDPVKQTQ